MIPTAADIARANPNSGRIAPNAPRGMAGEALSNLGQGIVQTAYNLNDLREAEQAETLRKRGNDVSTALTRFMADEEQKFLDASQNTSESGIGFTRSFMEGYQQRANDFAKSHFEGLSDADQTQYLNTILSRGNSLYEKAYGYEGKLKTAYYDRTTNQSLDTYRTQIRSNAASFDQLKAEGLRQINTADMPEPWKAERRAMWEQDAAESKWRWEFDRDPQKAIRDISPAGSVADKIVHIESGGRANAKNPNSSATGAGQFIDSTWLKMVREYRPDLARGKSNEQILSLRGDADLSREMVQHYADENTAYLRSKGIEATDGNIYLAHFLGPDGAARVLSADPGADVGSVIGGDAVKANPFLKGKTVADLRAWADRKMGQAPSQYASISYDRREQLASWGETQYRKQRNEDAAILKGHIEDVAQDAPVSISRTGKYDGSIPTRDDFIAAYGSQEGPDKFAAFQSALDVGRNSWRFQTMPEGDINAFLQANQPSASGEGAAMEAERYSALEKAAQATIKAREADPAAYTMQAFPKVAQAWQNAQENGDYRAALNITAAAQRQLGIRTPRLLPKAVASDAVGRFKANDISDQDRLSSAASLVFSTTDPKAQRAIFGQLVDAGLPAMAEGAMEAYARGDEGAARRLLRAAIVDPKDLPRDSTTTPTMISDAIYADVWADGEVGNVAYGLSYGDASSLGRAQRATDLMKRSVQLRMARGEDLDTAVAGAKEDLFGDVTVYDGSGDINAEMTVPADTDTDVLTNGLRAAKEDFALALVDQRDRLLTRGGGEAADGTKAILDATTQNRMNDVLTYGEFVQIGDGVGLRDPYTGGFVTDVDGVTPLTIPLDTILEKGKAADGTVPSRRPFRGVTLGTNDQPAGAF